MMSGTHPKISDTADLAMLVRDNGKVTIDANVIFALFTNNQKNFEEWCRGAAIAFNHDYQTGEVTLRLKDATSQKI